MNGSISTNGGLRGVMRFARFVVREGPLIVARQFYWRERNIGAASRQGRLNGSPTGESVTLRFKHPYGMRRSDANEPGVENAGLSSCVPPGRRLKFFRGTKDPSRTIPSAITLHRLCGSYQRAT